MSPASENSLAMKSPNRYILTVVLCLGLVVSWWFLHDFTANPERSGQTNPDAAMALRNLQTIDPATGTVPKERLWIANQAAEASGIEIIGPRAKEPREIGTHRCLQNELDALVPRILAHVLPGDSPDHVVTSAVPRRDTRRHP